MGPNRWLSWSAVLSIIFLGACTGPHSYRSLRTSSASPVWDSPPLYSHVPPLILAIPRLPSPSITASLDLLRQATHQAEMGRDREAMTLLGRAREVLLSDGESSMTPEVARLQVAILKEIEAFSEELAAIHAMTEIPSGEEGSLITPEDVTVLERAIPHIPAPGVEPEISYDVPIELNRTVEAYIELFTTRKRGEIASAMERAGRFLPLMREIFAEKGLPLDLVNLAYIESSFKLNAYSRAHAAGLWQFIRGTGRKYGLKINWWVDERRDPAKATTAAAGYLSDLYGIFESWPLAIAAYNSGEGRVLRAIRNQNTTNFWKLRLPRETRHFVPAFMAMTIIAKNPEKYGFTPPEEQPWAMDQIALPQPADLRLLAQAAGVTTEELRGLNPELRRLVTPPERGYVLNLPLDSEASFLAALEQLPQVQQVVWRQHRVRRGEALSTIARRYRTTVDVLMEMNHLKNPHRIGAGTSLTVPVPAFTVAQAASMTGQAEHVVRPGDTLWDIARAHQVSTRDLKRWNNLNSARIHPGHTLRLHPDTPEASQVTWREHRVRSGETLSTIAQRYGTTVALLMEMNRLQNPHRIRAGTRITVPVPSEASES